jgi:hypothetical protein
MFKYVPAVLITPQQFSKLKVMYYFFSLDGGQPLLSRIPTSSAKETASLKTTFWTIFCFVFVVQFSFLDLIKLLKREFNLAKRLWINEIDENLMNRYDANLLLIIEHTWKSWNDVVHFYSCVFTGRSFQFLLFLRSSNINLISDVLWFQRFDAEWFDEKIQRKFPVLTNFSVFTASAELSF